VVVGVLAVVAGVLTVAGVLPAVAGVLALAGAWTVAGVLALAGVVVEVLDVVVECTLSEAGIGKVGVELVRVGICL
jgi:hypothetical protein